jgi:hypothetical protein
LIFLLLEAASPAAVGAHEQQQDHDEKQKNERAYEGPTGDAEDDQGDDEKQKQIHEDPFVECFLRLLPAAHEARAKAARLSQAMSLAMPA